MNIKSLLLGSATALAVVSGAQAADAIVAAAPEPMEYVKVCDAFGTGYFYIPGTETCLKISGLVRYDLTYSSNSGLFGASGTNSNYKFSTYSNGVNTNSATQARLTIEAKNSTEVGTVYSLIQIRGTNGFVGGSGINTGSNFNGTATWFYAGIDAGAVGFEVGYNETAWVRFFNFGGFTDWGGLYDYAVRSYGVVQGKVDAFSYMVGAEDLTNTAGKTAGLTGAVKGTFGNYEGALGVNYDVTDKSWGMKGYVSATMDPVMLKLMGIYTSKVTSAYAPTKLAGAALDGFILMPGARVNITPKFFAAVDYSYAFKPKYWLLVGNVGYNVAKGFDVLLEGRYDKDKVAGGFLRFERNF
jgi:hypothetical protein